MGRCNCTVLPFRAPVPRQRGARPQRTTWRGSGSCSKAELLQNASVGLDLTPAARACPHMCVYEKSRRLGKSKGGQARCLQG